jgi:hypothetical protein
MVAIPARTGRGSTRPQVSQFQMVSTIGSPRQLASPAVPELRGNPIYLCSRGLLRVRSRFPESVENFEKAKHRLSQNTHHRLNDFSAEWIVASNLPGTGERADRIITE